MNDDGDAPVDPATPASDPLTSEAVAKLRAQMPPNRDEDVTLARPAPADPPDLVELAFEIYDRKSRVFRVITRAFTLSSRLVLAKVVLDSLAGVRTPLTARELFDFQTYRATPPARPYGDQFVCRYGTTHTPTSPRFLKSMHQCRDNFGNDRYDPDEPWSLEHRPYVAWQMDFGSGQNGIWNIVDPNPDSRVIVDQDY